jgi:formylglycine-generating enzyme required for sulfatase activity
MSIVRFILGYENNSFLAEKKDSEWIDQDRLYGKIRFKMFKKINSRDIEPIRDFLQHIAQQSTDLSTGPETGWVICVNTANLQATREHILNIFQDSHPQIDRQLDRFPQIVRQHVKEAILKHFDEPDYGAIMNIPEEYIHFTTPNISSPTLVFPYPHVYALLIAVDDYSSLKAANIPNRSAAIRGAQKLSQFLKVEIAASVKEFFGDQATLMNIDREGIGEHLQSAKPSDLVIFYFAGQGATRELEGLQKRGYLLTAETQTSHNSNDINWLTCRSVNDFVQTLSAEVKTQHILVILDVALDGVAGVEPDRVQPPNVRTLTRRVQNILVAGREGENLHDGVGPEQLSTFTGHMLLLLSDPTRFLKPHIEVVPSSEAMNQLKDNVELATFKKQHPYSLYINEKPSESNGEVLLFVRSHFIEMVPIGQSTPISVLVGSKKTDSFAQDDEFEQTRVKVQPFFISRSLITMEQYWTFIRRTNHPVPYSDEPWAQLYNWDEETRTPPMQYLDHPVILVEEEDILSYCKWLEEKWYERLLPDYQCLLPGYHVRLPTEAEWELAVRGSNGTIWPWGNNWENNRCNSTEAGLGGPSSIYKFPRQPPYELLDSIGNVWQRCCSFYAAYPFDLIKHISPERKGGRQHVLKGGAWNLDRKYVRCATRAQPAASDEYRFVGFRVVIGLPVEFSLLLSDKD